MGDGSGISEMYQKIIFAHVEISAQMQSHGILQNVLQKIAPSWFVANILYKYALQQGWKIRMNDMASRVLYDFDRVSVAFDGACSRVVKCQFFARSKTITPILPHEKCVSRDDFGT